MNFSFPDKFYPWLPFFTLLRRELLRIWRVAIQTLITPIITAALYLFVFGATLGDRISVIPDFSYAQFVIPGLILMGVINNAFTNSSSSLFMARYLGNIVDLLVTPISPPQFILAYTLASMLRGLFVGSVILLISSFFAEIPWAHPWHALFFALAASFIFAQFGLVAALYTDTFDMLAMYSNFLILPLTYFGGLFYPISILPPFWANVSQFNPVWYLIGGFRFALLGTGGPPLITCYLVIIVASAVLFVWTAVIIGKGNRLRN